MKVRRSTLLKHLQRISCGGQVTEAVFTDAFATQALTPDQLLLVIAPPLDEAEALTDGKVGFAGLPTLIKALGFISGEGNEATDVTIGLEDNRLVINEGDRGTLRLMTAGPNTIATRIEDATVEKLLAKAPTTGKVELSRSLVEGIRSTYAGFKATELEIFVGPKGGKVRVGNEDGNFAEFESKQLKAKEEYSLLFGEHIKDVLAEIVDFSEAELLLAGPNNFVVIQDSGYKYLLSPRSKSAENKVKAKKAEGGEAGAKKTRKKKDTTAAEASE